MRLAFWLAAVAAALLLNCGSGGASSDRNALETPHAAQEAGTTTTSDSPWPAARGYSQMVYDPLHEDVILLPGQSNTFTVVQGVWAFNTRTRTWRKIGTWEQNELIDMAVFDIAARKIIATVSFDWLVNQQGVSETWAFDPETGVWENRNPAVSPPPGICGCGEQMAYDPRARKTVKFGGEDVIAWFTCAANGCDQAGWDATVTNDTWVYDYEANTWSMMPRPADERLLPSPRNNHGMTYDSLRGRIIIAGGGGALAPSTDTTWSFDYWRNRWTNLEPSPDFTPRVYGTIAYDEKADKIVLFGGESYSK